jgi:hypothetical protein
LRVEFDQGREVQDFLARFRRAWVPGNVVTSWFRSLAENEEVGGDPDSQHLVGLAVDVDGPHLVQLEANCRDEGLVPVMEPDHLHVQRYPRGTLAAAQEQAGMFSAARSVDVLLNRILGGERGQTISARMGRRLRDGTATLPERALCGMLDLMDPDHCERAADLHDEPDLDSRYYSEPEEEDERPHHHHRHRHRQCKCRLSGSPEEPWWLRGPDVDEEDW